MDATAAAEGARLSEDVVPRHYDIEIAPDLDACTFTGTVGIDLEVRTDTHGFWCHAADLDITRCSLVVGGEPVEIDHHLDPAGEQLVIRPASRLDPGPARLEVRFTGTLNDRLRGFYRSTFTDEDGIDHTIATTQFQSTDARRAFPCWDEPAFKATFSTTLIVAPELLAVSNTAEVERHPSGDGLERIRFATTMPMSTYLVAFVVGPLEATDPVDVDGIPLRVVHRPGRGDQARFALEVGAHALRWLADYYDIPYPSDKVDLVALPDFASGAMENLGCVTFREVLLLVDPATASQPELQTVADVVNHELAHMWFGDLVTMRWWEGIWLNEAFATFMETACTDAFRPDWMVWTTFGRMRSAAFDTDSLASTRAIEYPVITPDDAEGMFDVITYEKGASVVRMLERYLGEDVFREGVRLYLRTHAYANTDTTDLWDALEQVSGQPVRSLMSDWIFQPGHPLVTLVDGDHGLVLEQRHFTLEAGAADGRTWDVPMRMRTASGAETTLLLDRRRRILTAPGDLATANVDGTGFYRVRPSEPMMEAIVRDGPGSLTTGERHAFVDDLWALTVAGEVTAAAFLRTITAAFADETDVTVWQAMTSGLASLARLVEGESRDRFAAAVDDLSRPVMDRLGPEPRPEDDDRTRELRATVLRLRGAVADLPEAVDLARGLLDASDATLAAAALTVVAHHGGPDEFERFRAEFLNPSDAQSEQRHLRALVDFPHADLVMSIVEETRNGVVRAQDGPYLLRRALTNRRFGGLVWAFVAEHWDELTSRFPSNSIVRMLEGITVLDDPDRARAVGEFLADHPVPQGDKQVSQHLERQRVNVALRVREAERFAAALTGT